MQTQGGTLPRIAWRCCSMRVCPCVALLDICSVTLYVKALQLVDDSCYWG
jgi:hypothetical protein